MAFQHLDQGFFLQLGGALDPMLLTQPLEAGYGLLQETPLDQFELVTTGFRILVGFALVSTQDEIGAPALRRKPQGDWNVWPPPELGEPRLSSSLWSGLADPAWDTSVVSVLQVGTMFWFMRKTLVGSYVRLRATSRSYIGP
jgi:hypothetical protein